MNDIIDYKKIGQRIKKARTDKKITQQKLCDALNISLFHYSKIENAKVSVTLDTLAELALFLDLEINYLITGTSKIDKQYLSNELSIIFNECTKPQQQLIIEMAKLIAKSEIKSVSNIK